MYYQSLNTNSNMLIVGITAIIGLFLLIIVYYIVVSKTPSDANSLYNLNQSPISIDISSNIPSYDNQPSNVDNTNLASSVPVVTSPKNPEVFNVKENIYTLDDAPAVCGALGSQVATIEQLIEAHKNGADWCNVGWTKDGIAAYPIQQSTWDKLQTDYPDNRNICGNPGINIVRNDPNLLYGVNCYGPKPDPKGDEKIRPVLLTDKQQAINVKIAELQKNLNNIGIAPFNYNEWSSY